MGEMGLDEIEPYQEPASVMHRRDAVWHEEMLHLNDRLLVLAVPTE